MTQKNYLIIGAIIIVIAGGAFYGGMQYQNNKLSSSGLLRGQGQGGFGGGQGQGGAGRRASGMMGGGPNGAGGGFSSGQIIAKDEKSITIKAQDGSSKIVFYSDSTTIGKTAPGAIADLTTGEQVVVTGKSNPDGSLTAQNVQIRPIQNLNN